MKFIITENKLERVAIHWMNQNFSPDQLEIYKSIEHPNSIFFKKNGKIVMEQDKKYKYFYFHYNDIWTFFELFLDMKDEQIKEVLRYWLEETLKLEGYIPGLRKLAYPIQLEETLKLEGYIPLILFGKVQF